MYDFHPSIPPLLGEECVQAIQNATVILDTMLSDKTQWPKVEKMFQVSTSLKNEDDVALLAEILAGNFMGVAQYNRDNTAFEGRPNNITTDDLCDIMTNASLGSPLERYATVNVLLLQSSGEDSVDANFSAQVEFMKEVSWNSSAVMGGARQWVYQTCTEFGYYQTTDSAKQPFGDLITLSSQLKMCSEVYGISPSDVARAVEATNRHYGGNVHFPSNASDIIFPNGSLDPWNVLGVYIVSTDSLAVNNVIVDIVGTAHCANMYPPSPHDLPQLVRARISITNNIQKWI